jgi:hypothetical protein
MISMTRRAAALAIAVPIGIALINVAVTSAVWLSYQDDYAKLKESFTLLDRPSRVLVGRSTDGPIGLPLWSMDHAPTLAVSAKAMVTTLFALPGIVSIKVVKEHRNQAITDGLATVDLEMTAVRSGLTDILAGSEAVLGSVREVVTGSQQIATAAEETSGAAAEAASAAHEQARGAEDLAAAIEEIAGLADELQIAKT